MLCSCAVLVLGLTYLLLSVALPAAAEAAFVPVALAAVLLAVAAHLEDQVAAMSAPRKLERRCDEDTRARFERVVDELRREQIRTTRKLRLAVVASVLPMFVAIGIVGYEINSITSARERSLYSLCATNPEQNESLQRLLPQYAHPPARTETECRAWAAKMAAGRP